MPREMADSFRAAFAAFANLTFIVKDEGVPRGVYPFLSIISYKFELSLNYIFFKLERCSASRARYFRNKDQRSFSASRPLIWKRRANFLAAATRAHG